MLCPKCEKESNNLRVCPFCQTPYPIDRESRGTPRMSRSVTSPRGTASIPSRAAGDPRIAMASKSKAKRWGLIGVLAVFTGGYWFFTREPSIPVGVAIPNLIAGTMTQIEAAAILRNANGTAEPEVKDGILVVKIGATIFPERRMGQIALAQQYSRADEIVNGKKRAISFVDPGGQKFASADPQKGVVMTR
jgi:hypothetical protein